jgi:hypothetical protein
MSSSNHPPESKSRHGRGGRRFHTFNICFRDNPIRSSGIPPRLRSKVESHTTSALRPGEISRHFFEAIPFDVGSGNIPALSLQCPPARPAQEEMLLLLR